MPPRLRSMWFALKASYWFYPALFALAAFGAALMLIHVDRAGMSGWLSQTQWIVPARPEGASNILTVIAGSMIGVASTVFSITIAAVAYASGTYGPRLLTNFMEDKGNQLSLATFIGTFVFSLTVLRAVRVKGEEAASALAAVSEPLPGFVPQLSLIVAYGLMILSIGVLVFFLHHIPSSIRINAVLEGIGHRLLDLIDKRFPNDDDGGEEAGPAPDGQPVPATHAGYVQVIDFSELGAIAERSECRIALAVRAGDFVHPGVPLAHLCDGEGDEDCLDAIKACLVLGASRTPEQDLQFSIDELVEIALRALSPGINDPFTAITAVHWLGAATACLGRRTLRAPSDSAKAQKRGVMPLPDDFAHFVNRGFGAARSGLASNRLAALVALQALGDAAGTIGDPRRRATLALEGNLLMEQAGLALAGPDLEDVRRAYSRFTRNLPLPV